MTTSIFQKTKAVPPLLPPRPKKLSPPDSEPEILARIAWNCERIVLNKIQIIRTQRLIAKLQARELERGGR